MGASIPNRWVDPFEFTVTTYYGKASTIYAQEQRLQQPRRRIRDLAGFRDLGEGAFTARRRHVEALRAAQQRFDAGRAALRDARAGELLAEELRLAQQALGTITGEVTADDLLGRIFSEFCIGK